MEIRHYLPSSIYPRVPSYYAVQVLAYVVLIPIGSLPVGSGGLAAKQRQWRTKKEGGDAALLSSLSTSPKQEAARLGSYVLISIKYKLSTLYYCGLRRGS